MFQESHNLTGSSQACIYIRFFSLSTHFLRSKEITAFELGIFSGIVRSDIGNIFEICLLYTSPSPRDS